MPAIYRTLPAFMLALCVALSAGVAGAQSGTRSTSDEEERQSGGNDRSSGSSSASSSSSGQATGHSGKRRRWQPTPAQEARRKAEAKRREERYKRKAKKFKNFKPDGAPARDQDRRFSKKVRNWRELKRQNIVMQKRDYSCGAAALATVAKYYWGDNLGEEHFLKIIGKMLTYEEAVDRIKNGLAMTDLRKAAVKAGYTAIVGKVTLEKLGESKVPLVVGITVDGYDHFVVYRGMDALNVYIADPIRGNLRVHKNDFLDQWQKNAILAIGKPGHKIKKTSRLSVRYDELFLGKLNDQIILTAPSRMLTRPARR